MPNYKNGKIYKLVNSIGTTYVGSTTQALCERKSSHSSHYKKYLQDMKLKITSTQIFIEDPFNVDIVLIELVNCNSKIELHQRERHWIEIVECVNKVIPNKTEQEKQDKNSKYYESNSEKLKQKAKKYYGDNFDKIKAYDQKLCVCECGKSLQQRRIMRHQKSIQHKLDMEFIQNRKDGIIIIKEEKCKLISCECGVLVLNNNYNRHIKSPKHQQYVESIKKPIENKDNEIKFIE